MSPWIEKELKLLKKLVKKGKTPKTIAEKFKKKNYNKNIFEIISKIRSIPELRPYFQAKEWTMDDLDKLVEDIQKGRKFPD